MSPELHLAENAFALHFLFQRLECLVDIVVANDDLQVLLQPVPKMAPLVIRRDGDCLSRGYDGRLPGSASIMTTRCGHHPNCQNDP
jgi:hypothetical protein